MVKIRNAKKTAMFSVLSTKEISEFIEIAPYKRLEDGLLVTHKDTYQKFLKIGTKNVYSMSSNDRHQVMAAYTNLCRLYVEDFSVISMRFPAYTDDNAEYWRNKYILAREQNDTVQMQSCENQLALMAWVQKNLANHEFYLVIYADTKSEMADNTKLLMEHSSRDFPLEELSENFIEKIVTKLMNLNTDI